MKYPPAVNEAKVGTYPASTCAGGGYVWDEVLEYRVWVHSEGESDYFYAFATFEEAAKLARKTKGAEKPLALILQKQYIDEPSPGVYHHIKKRRLTEWPVEFLARPKRTQQTIPDFLSPNAPPNRLDIIRGKANPRVSPPRRSAAATGAKRRR